MSEKIQLHNLSAHDFEQCLKCSICTVYCPVSAVEPNYPGPKHAGPDLMRYRMKDPDFFNETLKLCLNCKRCEVACPHGVKVGDIIQEARIQYSQHSPSLRDRMLANTDFVGSMATLVAPLTNFFLGLSPAKTVLDKVMKMRLGSIVTLRLSSRTISISSVISMVAMSTTTILSWVRTLSRS